MNEKNRCCAFWGLCPQNPGIYRIAAKGKWQVPGVRLSASTAVALAFGIDVSKNGGFFTHVSRTCPSLGHTTHRAAAMGTSRIGFPVGRFRPLRDSEICRVPNPRAALRFALGYPLAPRWGIKPSGKRHPE
jgi:hypothetical protein